MSESTMPGPFTGADIQNFLSNYGYTSNPEGLAQPFPIDFVSESQAAAYLDVNADAVRKGNEVPDRPLRITFHLIFDGEFSRWKLQSVEELAIGVESKALDRHPETSKISPWPNLALAFRAGSIWNDMN
jgi:hypothetical protein